MPTEGARARSGAEPRETGSAGAGGGVAESDRQVVERLKRAYAALRAEIAKVVVGTDEAVEQLLVAIFSRGHAVLEGVPGLAKTLLVSTLARCLGLSFHRIQFTPDLMPSDITGTEVLQDDPGTGARTFKFLPGPIFANIILADEINRTPPKTQAALLEAMQEKRVSMGGTDYELELPFFVLATQNPIEQEGTYPLPEAQLDRFLFKIFVNYPSDEQELEIMKRVASPLFAEGEKSVRQVLKGEEIIRLQDLVLRVPVAEHVLGYARKLVRSTRPETEEAPDFVKEWLSWGAGPRASIYLIIAGKARAILYGNYHVSCDDVATVAYPVLRHRVICNYTAQAEGITTDDIIGRLLSAVPKDEKLS
jgi:MoxR-like ATPase